MRTSKLKIDLDSTCKELKFYMFPYYKQVQSLQTSGSRLLFLKQERSPSCPPCSALAVPEVNRQDFGRVLQQGTLISRVELTDLLRSCHLTPE